MIITILAYKPECSSSGSDFQWKSSPDYGVVAEFLAVITFQNMIANPDESGYIVNALFDGEPSEDAGTASILVEIYKMARDLAKAKYAAHLEEMVFVFGSNELGIHGGGAARVARTDHGAILHQGFGPQGDSFGIPTCSKPTGEPNHEISLEKISYYVACFMLWAMNHPRRNFKVTQIGCGLAGWTIEQMATLFKDAPGNCYFDTAWQGILGDKYKYWGHVG